MKKIILSAFILTDAMLSAGELALLPAAVVNNAPTLFCASFKGKAGHDVGDESQAYHIDSSGEMHVRCLAMNIEKKIFNLEDQETLSPSACASVMKHNDLEVLLAAAKYNIVCETKSSIRDPLISFLMHSSDPLSVELLKVYLPETGVIQTIDTLPYVEDTKNLGAWAKDLSRELVLAKAKVAYPAPRVFSQYLSAYVKGTSEGELAFKKYIQDRENPGFILKNLVNPLDQKKPNGCTIL